MAKVYLDANEESYRVGSNSDIIFGNSGTEVVTVTTGTSGTVFDQNVERIVLSGAIANYTYSQTGNVFNVYETVAGVKSLVASIPVQPDANGTQLTFSDGTVNAVLTGQVMKFGDTTLVNGASDTNLAPSPAAVDESLTSSGVPGTSGFTYTLTTGIDTFNGSTYNDTFIAENSTATGLDTLNGGSGTDTLIYNDLVGNVDPGAAGMSVTSIETVNARSAFGATIDTTPFVGVTALNLTQATSADLTVAATTAVNVSGVTGTTGYTNVTGGLTQTISSKGGVDLEGSVGAIKVTNLELGGNAIYVDNGTTVDVTATSTSSWNYIEIGGTKAPTGAITVVENLNGKGGISGGYIQTNGGTTVNVTVNATEADLTGVTTYNPGVQVDGGAATTSVTVKTTADVAAVAAVTAVAAVKETGSAVFTGMVAGNSITIDGLTFTASGTLTAAQTAAAFANITKGATQGNSTLGVYTGANAGNFTSGAVTTATVVFTSTASGNVADLSTLTSAVGATAPVITETQGVAETKAVAGVGGIQANNVYVNDLNSYSSVAAGTITTVSIDGYGYNSYVASNALSSLSLANSEAGSNLYVGIDNLAPGASTALALTVNNVNGNIDLDYDTAAITTFNVTTATKDSAVATNATAVQALTVAGTNALDLTGSTFSALKTVTVSGAAGVTIDASGATVTDVNAAATSGNNTVTLDATKATYEGGSGVDAVTLTAVLPTKAISLGAGNDKLALAAGTTAVTGAIIAGDGTDTLKMNAADANSATGASSSVLFASKVTGFEVLELNPSAAIQTVKVDVLGPFNSVITGGASVGALTLDGFTSGGTLTLNADVAGGSYVVSSAAFATPTTDTFNLVLTKAGALAAGTVTAAKVESFTIAANDTTKAAVAGSAADSLTLVAADATALTITGNAHLTLTSANVKVTSVDASAMTGGLTYTAAGGVAETIKGGASANILAASTGNLADTLIGGAGNDSLTSNAGLNILTGNGGNDTFKILTASLNSSSYATITDANAGDILQFGTAATFASAKITLADTAVFQDYCNAAINNTNIGDVTWFQYAGATYVIDNASDGTSFVNGTDFIVKLTGLVDLSNTSINTTSDTLLIG